jgi:AcrR family transcriptional regulator
VNAQTSKRRSIVAGATATFLERGYAGATMSHIARSAQASKQTVYNQFGSKEALFEAAVSDIWARFETLPDRESGDQVDSPRAAMMALGCAIADFWSSSAVVPFLRMVVAETPRFPDLRRMFSQCATSRIVGLITRLLRRLAERGLVDIGDPDLAALQWLGLLSQPLLWSRVVDMGYRPAEDDHERLVAQSVDMFLGYYGVRCISSP